MTTAWLLALAGGVLIGLSATLLLWLNGRVAGVSGILKGTGAATSQPAMSTCRRPYRSDRRPER